MQIKKGSFMGHPAGLVWANMANSPVSVTQEQIFSKISRRLDTDKEGNPVKPPNIENEKFMAEYEMNKFIPELQTPAVWLPHGILGISNSEIVSFCIISLRRISLSLLDEKNEIPNIQKLYIFFLFLQVFYPL